MELSDYNKKLKVISDEYDKKKYALAREYALYHSVAEIGDIVEDHYQRVLVEKINVYRGATVPSCIYYGPELTKDGKPRKDGRYGNCYQINLGR